MDHRSLLDLLASPRRVVLSREVWEVSAILAGLRERANDPIRAADRNRGKDKNWLADIWGVLGEIVALRVINEMTAAPVEHQPIDFERSVDDVDLVIHLGVGPLRLETKTHLLDPKKRWFMVNERAHRRSVGRGAMGYVPIVGVLGGPRVIVGSLLTIEDLDGWAAPSVPLRDPAVGVPMRAIASTHFGEPLERLSRSLREPPSLVSEAELNMAAVQAGRDFDRWRAELPALHRLSAAELRDEVIQVRDRIARSTEL